MQAENLYKRAEEAIEALPKGEIESWLQHPCTQSLILRLKGDVEEVKDQWAQGTFTEQEAYGTVQKNAQAIGELAGYQTAIMYIETILGE